MKVFVMQADEATFRRWSFWSDWVDICVFTYDIEPYLMQMKISRFNGKKFRTTNMMGNLNFFLGRSLTVHEVGDLLSMMNLKKGNET